MRILLSDTWAGGGASTFVAILAKGLTASGHDVDVVLGYREARAVDTYRPFVRQIFAPPTDFSRLALKWDYDVVHMTEQDLHPPFAYARRVRALGLKAATVVTCHTAEGVIGPGADAVVFVSEHARSAVEHAAPRVAVIPNGVDAEWLRAQADDSLVGREDRPIAIWSGRLVENPPQKDFLGFGYALHSLLTAGWHVLVLDGAPPSEVWPAERQLQRWFGDTVQYVNQAPWAQVLGALRRAGETGGAFISTSRVEAAPFIALEAVALGCPVVAPRIAGYADLIKLGAVTEYQSLAGLLEVLGSRSYTDTSTELPQELTAARMAERYVELYERVTVAPRRTWRTVGRRTLVRMGVGRAMHGLRTRLG